MSEYTLEGLQKLFGRAGGATSRRAKPLNIEKLKGKWRHIVETAIDFIVTSYKKDPIPLSIRQVHYYLVHAGVDYYNDLKHVKKLTTYILKARIGGQIPWEMISEEESKATESVPIGMDPEEAIKKAIEDAKNATGTNPWHEMGKYVMVFSEKRELGPQLREITYNHFVRLVCVRGYGMWSRLHLEGRRIRRELEKDRDCYVLFVTDHDPSGLDLNRLAAAILRNYWQLGAEDRRAMLTIQQVRLHTLLPAPTKVTDPRAKWYLGEYGHESWEVDALGKELMQKTLTTEIEKLIDWDIWDRVMEENRANVAKTEEMSKELLKKWEEEAS